MKPPQRDSRTVRAKCTSRSSAPKCKVEKVCKWKTKEKCAVLAALQSLTKPTLPDDLLKIQQKVPSRSTAEIEAYLNSLTADTVKNNEKNRKMFADANLKKWIDAADGLTGMERTCSSDGNGLIEVAHPALAVVEVLAMPGTDGITTEETGEGDKSDCNWDSISWFLSKIVLGEDPFEEWDCRQNTESAIILQLIEDLLTTSSVFACSQQHEFLFNKYREKKPEVCGPPYVDQPMPIDIFGSKFLNPFGMTKDMCESVQQTLPESSLLEQH